MKSRMTIEMKVDHSNGKDIIFINPQLFCSVMRAILVVENGIIIAINKLLTVIKVKFLRHRHFLDNRSILRGLIHSQIPKKMIRVKKILTRTTVSFINQRSGT